MKLLEVIYQHERNEIVNYDNIDLRYEYEKLNEQLFDGKLSVPTIGWNKRKGVHGMVKVRNTMVGRDLITGQLVYKRKVVGLWMSVFYKQPYHVFLDTLAHEMIHIYQAEKNIKEKPITVT